MRKSVTNRLIVLATVAVMVTAFGATTAHAGSSQAHTSASRAALTYPTPLTASDFQQVSLQGFGDPQNSWAWSMAWFKNNLYVGTNRALLCYSYALLHFLPYPPSGPALAVPCTPSPQSLPLAAEIWRMTPPTNSQPITQSNWTQVYTSPTTYNGQPIMVNITGTTALTPAARDMGYRGMTVYTDTEPDGSQQEALYVSGADTAPLNGQQIPPPSLLRTTDGTNFQEVPADPGTTLGNVNHIQGLPETACCMRDAVSYNGRMYLLIGDVQGEGRVYVSSNPQAGDSSFQQFTPNDMLAYEMQVFNGHLYIGTMDLKGYRVMRTDGCATTPCADSDFTQVVQYGGGRGSWGNEGVISMVVYTDTTGTPYLYVGTQDGITLHPEPAEIIRIDPTPPNQPDHWDLIVGSPRQATEPGQTKSVWMYPTSGLDEGFGWWFNFHMWRMAVYNGVLYVSTYDASTALTRFLPGISKLTAPFMGFDLYASSDGLTFTKITDNGFGDPFSEGARTMVPTPYGMFLGTANQWQGLRMWLGTYPADQAQLAPQSTQVDTTTTPGALALSWLPSANTGQFTVYRSTVTPVTLTPSQQSGSGGQPRAVVAGLASNKGQTIWIPGKYTAIGTTSSPYFIDRKARSGAHYQYVIVARDAHTGKAAVSTVVSYPAVLPPATFGGALAFARGLAAQKDITARHLSAIVTALRTAQARLAAGHAGASLATLRALRDSLSTYRSLAERASADTLKLMLGRLEAHVALVGARVVGAGAVQ